MQKILFIGKVWPEPKSSAAGIRMMQLLEIFAEAKYEVHFASAAQESEFSTPENETKAMYHKILLNDESFDVFVKNLNPGIVVFDRFTSEEQFGWRVAAHCPEALRILDTEDLHGLRAAREQSLKKKTEGETDLNLDIVRRELASIYRSDLSLIISRSEIQLLEEHFRMDPKLIYYLPMFAGPDANKNTQLPSFKERNHFVSIGNFLHAPNKDAVLYLKKEIWPLIRKHLPKAELHIYGAYPDEQIFQLQDKKTGFLIKGRADNAAEVMRMAKVCLAPLRFGAGLKGKLLLAMENGTPNVTTSIGAEGMQADLAWSGAIADSPEAFAVEAVSLYNDSQLWSEKKQTGFSILDKLFRKEDHGPDFIKKITDLKTNLESHRSLNFIGAILHHQNMQSTKYMALWIEAKNKLKVES